MASKLGEKITLEIDRDHLAAIGKIATLWASFELSLCSIIWVLSGLDAETGSRLTTQMFGWNAKLNAIHSLAAMYNAPKPILDKIEKYAQKTNSFAQERNRFVHDPWMQTESGSHYHLDISWANRKFTFAHKPMSLGELSERGIAISEHTAKIWDIFEEIKNNEDVRNAWQEKHRKPLSDPPPDRHEQD